MPTSTPSSPNRPERPARRCFGAAALAAGLAAVFALALAVTPGAARAQSDTGGLADLPLIRLDVAAIVFVPAYAASGRAPNIEHRAPFPPADVLGEWAKTHLVAAGRRGTAHFTVREAAIVSVPLRERTANWRDWFRRQPVERFDGAVEIALELRDESGRVLARIEARATQSAYLMDDWKPGDREKRLATLTEQMVGAALRRLAERLRDVAAAYVLNQ
jgi:hypothetical protein